MKKTIQVTVEHIAKGVPSNAERCPVALALQDAGLHNPLAGYVYMYWGTKDAYGARPHKAKTADPVYMFMKAVDAEMPVEPFSFDIEVPENA